MMRSKFSRLAVLGLAAISGQVFAAVSLSGQVRLDTKFVSEPDTTADSMEISRARLNLLGDVSSDWTAGVRLDKSESGDNIVLSRAYAAWSGLENTTVKVGKTGHISTDADDSYYAPYTTLHGTLDGFHGDDTGLSVKGSMGSFGYGLGVVNSSYTPDGADDTGLGWSYGARGHFTAVNSDSMSWGLGFGYVHRLHDDLTFNFSDGATTDTSTFDKYTGWTFDVSGVVGNFALTGALYSRTDKHQGTLEGDGTAATLADNPYAKDGKSNSYYFEGMYLVMGDGYGFGDGVVSGAKFASSALEVGLRYGHVTRENAAEVLHATGDATTSTEALTASSELKAKTKSTSFLVNYHVNSNAALLGEFYTSKTTTTNNTLAANPADVKAKHLNLRAQFSF